jgi:2-iminoacetate synthase
MIDMPQPSAFSLQPKHLSFHDLYSAYANRYPPAKPDDIDGDKILRLFQKPKLTPPDLLALLSQTADPHLEDLAQKAHELTLRNFGRTIVLYTPMYLSNFCTNQCLYCGFGSQNKIFRKQLTLNEVEREAEAIAATGLRHILVLTGDAPKIATLEYLKSCIRILTRYFTSIGIEIYALKTDEYAELIDAGVDSLTIYQETYNLERYQKLHIKGPKKNYRFRLEAPERAGRAGMRSVNIGALLGLDDWRREAFFTGLHADYLQHHFPQMEIGISLPRIRPHVGEFQDFRIFHDRILVQILAALRLYIPRAVIAISTRESARLRDHLIHLGVTKMSAGSTTKVGGRTQAGDSTGQFDISDHRSVDEMRRQIQLLGYQPVFKDWHPLHGAQGYHEHI